MLRRKAIVAAMVATPVAAIAVGAVAIAGTGSTHHAAPASLSAATSTLHRDNGAHKKRAHKKGRHHGKRGRKGTGQGNRQGTGNQQGGAGRQGAGGTQAGGAVRAVSCPDVASKLPTLPAAARAEVTRNLNLLQTQITEADHRLATTVGQGGPNFVQNAILGPLRDKRVSTIDRIVIAIGRTGAARPTNLDALATCTLG
jgi:hypothetical protein